MMIKIYVVDLNHQDVCVSNGEDRIELNGETLIEGAFDPDATGVVAFGEDGRDSVHYVAADSFETWLSDFPDQQDEDTVDWYNEMYFTLNNVDTELSGAAYKVVEVELM